MKLFDRIKNFLKTQIFKDEFVHLAITIFFVFGIYFFEQNHSSFTIPEWTLCILLMLLICLVYLVMRFVDINTEKRKEEFQKREFEKDKPVSVEFKVNRFENGHRKDIAYEVSLNVVNSAERRLIIVADYSPKTEEMKVTQKRQEYYKTIEALLTQRIKNNKSYPFEYIRYMQRDEKSFNSIVQKNGVINDYDLIKGDEQAFHHCRRVLEITKNQENVKLELYVTRNVPSLPSILVVDDNKLLFTIPERIKKVSKLETAGVLDFTDNTSGGIAIVAPFVAIVNSLKEDYGDEVIKLRSIDNFQNEEFKRWL